MSLKSSPKIPAKAELERINDYLEVVKFITAVATLT